MCDDPKVLIRPDCSICKYKGKSYMCKECYGYPDGRAENSFEFDPEKAKENDPCHN